MAHEGETCEIQTLLTVQQVNSIDSKEKGRDPLTSRGGDIPVEATSTQPVRGAGSNFADLGF